MRKHHVSNQYSVVASHMYLFVFVCILALDECQNTNNECQLCLYFDSPLRARQNTAQLVKILSDTTQQNV